MREFVQPKVVVSKCLGFAHCRYNGDMITSPVVEKLRAYVDFIPVCAEMEIGLGVPRHPLRIVSGKGELYRLVQPETGRDLTEEMQKFTGSFLDSLEGVEGFILKYRSPSCGIKDVKVYPSVEKSGAIAKTSGFFGGAVRNRFSYLAVEDEGRLLNARIREHFLTKLFLLASFHRVKNEGKIRDLISFHTENKFLFMAYSQSELLKLARIVANEESKPFKELVLEYQAHLYKALLRAPRYTSNINVLMHAFGYFSKDLSPGEKALFLDSLKRYREGKVSLCPAISVLQAWIVRFEEDYLARQTFFEPYPVGLMEVDAVNSDKREDLWE